jgi:hypothetical protein
MKQTRRTVKLDNGELLTLEVEAYQKNGVMAVVASNLDGQRYAVVSVNMEQADPEPGCFWLKDWSENQELAAALLRQGVIELTGRICITGFVQAKEARFV